MAPVFKHFLIFTLILGEMIHLDNGLVQPPTTGRTCFGCVFLHIHSWQYITKPDLQVLCCPIKIALQIATMSGTFVLGLASSISTGMGWTCSASPDSAFREVVGGFIHGNSKSTPPHNAKIFKRNYIRPHEGMKQKPPWTLHNPLVPGVVGWGH